MPATTIETARQSLRLARGLISGAAISLEHVISRNEDDRPGDPTTPAIAMQVSLEQRGAWIIGELEHAIASIRRAQTTAEALQAIARCEEAEAAEAAQSRAAA